MEKQMMLPLDPDGEDRLRRLWTQIPGESREELVALYGKLIAQALRVPKQSQQQESAHDVNDR